MASSSSDLHLECAPSWHFRVGRQGGPGSRRPNFQGLSASEVIRISLAVAQFVFPNPGEGPLKIVTGVGTDFSITSPSSSVPVIVLGILMAKTFCSLSVVQYPVGNLRSTLLRGNSCLRNPFFQRWRSNRQIYKISISWVEMEAFAVFFGSWSYWPRWKDV